MSAVISCEGCGKRVEAKRSDRVWCDECRAARARERQDRYEHRQKDTCPDCGGSMVRRAEFCLRCSNRHRGEKRRAENNVSWKGGRTKANGYVYVRASHKSGAGAYRPEHHVVWEEAHGQPLPKGWIVHHLNGVTDDNRSENLAGMPRHLHHQKPREALLPYEERIRQLEEQIRLLTSSDS